MSYNEIWHALDLLAAQFTAGGDLVQEGNYYAPIDGRPYVLTKLASYTRTPTGPGPNPVYREDGSYMVSIRRPLEEGRTEASALADQVVALFPRSTAVITVGGQVVSLMAATAMPAIIEGAWITVPVMVRWLSSE